MNKKLILPIIGEVPIGDIEDNVCKLYYFKQGLSKPFISHQELIEYYMRLEMIKRLNHISTIGERNYLHVHCLFVICSDMERDGQVFSKGDIIGDTKFATYSFNDKKWDYK